MRWGGEAAAVAVMITRARYVVSGLKGRFALRPYYIGRFPQRPPEPHVLSPSGAYALRSVLAHPTAPASPPNEKKPSAAAEGGNRDVGALRRDGALIRAAAL